LLLTGLALSDLVCLLAAFGAAAFLASRPSLGAHRGDYYGIFILLMVPVFAVFFVTQGLYDPHNLLAGTREYASVFRACIYGLVALILLSYAVHRHISREWIVFSGTLAIAFVGWSRFALRRLAHRLRRHGYFTTRALLVGVDADSIAMARQLNIPGTGVRVVGFLDDYAAAGSTLAPDLKVLGAPATLMQTVTRTRADEAIVVPQALPWESLQTVITEATAASSNGLQVHLSAGFYDLLTTGVRLSERNHVPLLTIGKARLSPFETAFKMALDYLIAGGLLVLFAPVLALVALRLRLDNSGNVLERRRVLGRYGKPFDQLSIRSVAPFDWAFVCKLPGLVNVLRGQLSLIGPRPIAAHDGGAGVRGAAILAIRPGLTGPWRQVNDINEQALLDLYYIKSYSVWLDLQVLFKRITARFHR
jgi:lipopolysaccharide/colanic/teichoic acid biosynthesis glycosyltransferase